MRFPICFGYIDNESVAAFIGVAHLLVGVFSVNSNGSSIPRSPFFGNYVKFDDEIFRKLNLFQQPPVAFGGIQVQPVARSNTQRVYFARFIGCPQCRKIADCILTEIFVQQHFIARHKIIIGSCSQFFTLLIVRSSFFVCSFYSFLRIGFLIAFSFQIVQCFIGGFSGFFGSPVFYFLFGSIYRLLAHFFEPFLGICLHAEHYAQTH